MEGLDRKRSLCNDDNYTADEEVQQDKKRVKRSDTIDDDELRPFDDDEDYEDDTLEDVDDDDDDDDDSERCDCGDCGDCDAAAEEAEAKLYADADNDDDNDIPDVIENVVGAMYNIDTSKDVFKWYARVVRVWVRIDESHGDDDDDATRAADFCDDVQKLRAALRWVILAYPSYLCSALSDHIQRTSRDPDAIDPEHQRMGAVEAEWSGADAYVVELLFDNTTATSLRVRLDKYNLVNKADKMEELCTSFTDFVCNPHFIRYAEIIEGLIGAYHDEYDVFQKQYLYFVLLPYDNAVYKYGSGFGYSVENHDVATVDLKTAMPLTVAYTAKHSLFADDKAGDREGQWRNFDYMAELRRRRYNWNEWRGMPVLVRRALVDICRYTKPCYHVGATCTQRGGGCEPLCFPTGKARSEWFAKEEAETAKNEEAECKRVRLEVCSGKCAAVGLCDCPIDQIFPRSNQISMEDVRGRSTFCGF